MDSVDGEVVSISAAVVAELQTRITALAKERDEYKHLAELLQRELNRLRDLQKTPREHVDAAQIQLAFAAIAAQLLEKMGAPANAAAANDAAGTSGGGNAPPAAPPKKPPKRTPHGRAVLPEHLPVETLVLKPADVPADAVVIDEEVSWRLGFRRASFFRLKLVRPVYVVSKDASANDEVAALVLEGDVSSVAAAASVAAVDGRADAAEVASAGANAPSASPAHLVEEAAATPTEVTGSVAATSATAEGTSEPASGTTARTTIWCAPPPDEIIPRGLPLPDLLAHILTGKFADKLPFNRQEGIIARSGVRITRGTMCSWVERAHAIAKYVVQAMCDEAMAKAHFIATDATGVLVQANEKCKKGHFWVFVADRDHVFYRYSARHSHDEPLDFFRGFHGIVLADASSVYDALFRLPDGPDEAGCNSHARRYFYKALASDNPRALVGVAFFNRLFELERAFAKLPPPERLRMRQEQSAPVVEQLAAWRMDQLTQVPEGTPIRTALNYLGNHWDALTRFLRDGHIPIHNNWSELHLRSLVVGRANWLFVGSDESAAWTCTFVSLVASCQLHGLDPQAYFRDLFRVLPSWPRNRVLELAPKYWRATRTRLDLAELALPLGPLTVPPRLTPSEAEQSAQKPDADEAGRLVVHAR